MICMSFMWSLVGLNLLAFAQQEISVNPSGAVFATAHYGVSSDLDVERSQNITLKRKPAAAEVTVIGVGGKSGLQGGLYTVFKEQLYVFRPRMDDGSASNDLAVVPRDKSQFDIETDKANGILKFKSKSSGDEVTVISPDDSNQSLFILSGGGKTSAFTLANGPRGESYRTDVVGPTDNLTQIALARKKFISRGFDISEPLNLFSNLESFKSLQKEKESCLTGAASANKDLNALYDALARIISDRRCSGILKITFKGLSESGSCHIQIPPGLDADGPFALNLVMGNGIKTVLDFPALADAGRISPQQWLYGKNSDSDSLIQDGLFYGLRKLQIGKPPLSICSYLKYSSEEKRNEFASGCRIQARRQFGQMMTSSTAR